MFVAIVKQSNGKNGPVGFPLECREYQTLEQAQAAHPNGVIMTVEAYQEHAQKWAVNYQAPKYVEQTKALVIKKRPWWKFWGKR